MSEKNIVDYVAGLARVALSVQEKEVLSEQFAHILEYIDKLDKLDVKNVVPLRQLHQDCNVFRQDVVFKDNFQQDILNNAPAREGDYFKIPKVIE